MKRYLCVFLAIVLAFSALALTGCDGDNNNNSETKTTKATSETAETTSQPKETTAKKEESEIQSYLNSFLEGDSDFYGAWQIEEFDYMSILFRNDNLAELVTGTEGYFSKCTIDTKKKTVTVQLMPNVIDGEYNYEFSKDKNKLTLTLDNNSLVLNRQKDFSMLPKAPEKPMIDSDILGWWENEDGLFYCFQEDGVMYENGISMETCYTYTVGDGKITATYSSAGELTDDFTYSFKDGVLTLDGSKCTRKNIE